MLNAYRGEWSDVIPVAPEFWYYLPARVLGVDMVTFEREVPLWQALRATFQRYQAEGWCIVSPDRPNPQVERQANMTRVGDGRFEERATQ